MPCKSASKEEVHVCADCGEVFTLKVALGIHVNMRHTMPEPGFYSKKFYEQLSHTEKHQRPPTIHQLEVDVMVVKDGVVAVDSLKLGSKGTVEPVKQPSVSSQPSKRYLETMDQGTKFNQPLRRSQKKTAQPVEKPALPVATLVTSKDVDNKRSRDKAPKGEQTTSGGVRLNAAAPVFNPAYNRMDPRRNIGRGHNDPQALSKRWNGPSQDIRLNMDHTAAQVNSGVPIYHPISGDNGPRGIKYAGFGGYKSLPNTNESIPTSAFAVKNWVTNANKSQDIRVLENMGVYTPRQHGPKNDGNVSSSSSQSGGVRIPGWRSYGKSPKARHQKPTIHFTECQAIETGQTELRPIDASSELKSVMSSLYASKGVFIPESVQQKAITRALHLKTQKDSQSSGMGTSDSATTYSPASSSNFSHMTSGTSPISNGRFEVEDIANAENCSPVAPKARKPERLPTIEDDYVEDVNEVDYVPPHLRKKVQQSTHGKKSQPDSGARSLGPASTGVSEENLKIIGMIRGRMETQIQHDQSRASSLNSAKNPTPKDTDIKPKAEKPTCDNIIEKLLAHHGITCYTVPTPPRQNRQNHYQGKGLFQGRKNDEGFNRNQRESPFTLQTGGRQAFAVDLLKPIETSSGGKDNAPTNNGANRDGKTISTSSPVTDKCPFKSFDIRFEDFNNQEISIKTDGPGSLKLETTNNHQPRFNRPYTRQRNNRTGRQNKTTAQNTIGDASAQISDNIEDAENHTPENRENTGNGQRKNTRPSHGKTNSRKPKHFDNNNIHVDGVANYVTETSGTDAHLGKNIDKVMKALPRVNGGRKVSGTQKDSRNEQSQAEIDITVTDATNNKPVSEEGDEPKPKKNSSRKKTGKGLRKDDNGLPVEVTTDGTSFATDCVSISSNHEKGTVNLSASEKKGDDQIHKTHEKLTAKIVDQPSPITESANAALDNTKIEKESAVGHKLEDTKENSVTFVSNTIDDNSANITGGAEIIHTKKRKIKKHKNKKRATKEAEVVPFENEEIVKAIEG